MSAARSFISRNALAARRGAARQQQQFAVANTRRQASSSSSSTAHGSSSDIPWLVASVAVFGPTIWYLTQPPASAHHHDASPKLKPSTPTPVPASQQEPAQEKAAAAEADGAPRGKAEQKEQAKQLGETESDMSPEEFKQKRAEGAPEARAHAKSQQSTGHQDAGSTLATKNTPAQEGHVEGGKTRDETPDPHVEAAKREVSAEDSE